jgi:hypothetical protein
MVVLTVRTALGLDLSSVLKIFSYLSMRAIFANKFFFVFLGTKKQGKFLF